MEEEKEEVQISGSETESVKKSPVDSVELKLRAIINEGALDFDGWTALIEVVEETYHDDIEKICLVYESFLSDFPLCYGYWRKLADHKTRLCTIDKAVEVFEGAVQSATYSVDVWVDYCCFSVSAFEDPCDVRRLFRRGLSFVGKDYLCHKLWDKFIEFELSQQHWSSLAHIYIQTLRFPTKKLHRYYDSFKKLVAIWEEEMECQSDSPNKLQSELMHDIEVPTRYKDEDISSIIKDLLDPSIGLARSHALSKYLSVGEHFYQSACQLDKQICLFETHIRRSYFHTKPLDVCQLENWHQYLDFVEAQGDFDWAVKLYERCLIPCCNYPDFWMRYVDFMETKGGREIAIFALDRTTQNFLKRVPVIHLFNARFKEQIGDVVSAREAVLQYKAETDSGFVENVIRKANMEKRLGNYAAASSIYVEALEIDAAKEKSQTLPILYVQFSRLKLITGGAEAARDVLIDGIKQVSRCKLLVEELIRLATIHEGARDINMINSVMASTVFSEPGVSRGLTAEEREEISNLYLEFVDFCGNINDVRSAWNRHIKWFPHSVRTEINFPSPDAPLNAGIEERKETFVALLQPVSENCNDESMTLAEDNLPLSPENQDPQSNISDQKLENQDIQSHQPEDADSARHDGEQLVSPEFSVSVTEQPKDVSEPRPSSPNLSLHEVANESDSTQASQGYSKNNLHIEEHDREPELAAKPLSLETLSLDAKDNKSTSHQYEAPQETCMSNGSMEGGRHAHQARAASPSSSASHQIPTTYQHDRNWHQMRYNSRYRRDPKFGFRGNSQKRQHQDRHRHVSSQQQYPQGGGPPVLNSQGEHFSQVPNQYQASAGVQIVQQPAAQPQAVQYQYPVQGNDQYTQAQDSEAYNQMWQYYYYQQQQQQYFMQQQQQLLQQQQQELDPQQQQLLYQQQLQLQQQYIYQQQQQFQQLSEQQQQQQQQQQQHQQSAYQQPQQQQLDEQQQYLQQQQFLQQQQQYQLCLQQLQQSQQNQPPEVEQQEEELEQPSQQREQEQEQVHENHNNCKLVSSQLYHDSGSHLEVEETRQHITSSQSQRRVMPSDDTDTEISI